MSEATGGERHDEAPTGGLGTRLNWLRAAVLGANDGIVSTAGIVVGVAGRRTYDRRCSPRASRTARRIDVDGGGRVCVGLHATALRDGHAGPGEAGAAGGRTGRADRHAGGPRPVGGGCQGGRRAAHRQTRCAHARVEHGIEPEELANPWHAAGASFLAFTAGALLPLLAVMLPPASARLYVTVPAVLAAMALTGWWSARLGAAAAGPAVLRNVCGGALAMAVTYAAGSAIGAAGV